MARNFHVFSNIVRLKYFTEKTKIKYAFDHFVRESINDIVLFHFAKISYWPLLGTNVDL